MRKNYLDNIRWVTVVLVVLYHVIYMYNGQGITGPLGKITDLKVQYYDVYQYIVYPWFMMLLFIVSGMSSRFALDHQTGREFIKSRTNKLLVPVTIGLFAFQFIQGYINISFSGVTDDPQMPFIGKFIAMILSGIGVLWYIQMLWLFSLLIVLVKKIDKDRFWKVCGKINIVVLILLSAVSYGVGQILNTPLIVCYRFGLYLFAFLAGYFIFSHDEVMELVKKYFWLLFVLAAALCIAFCAVYFGRNYADNPVYRSALYLTYGWFGCLAMLGGFARFFDFSNAFTSWMSKRSWGLYVFHYLGISAVALFIAKPGLLPPWACYLMSTIAGFALAYVLNFVISRIPLYRWAVLGITRKKKELKK